LKSGYVQIFRPSAENPFTKTLAGLPTYNTLYAKKYISTRTCPLPSRFCTVKKSEVFLRLRGQWSNSASRFLSSLLNAAHKRRTAGSYSVVKTAYTIKGKLSSARIKKLKTFYIIVRQRLEKHAKTRYNNNIIIKTGKTVYKFNDRRFHYERTTNCRQRDPYSFRRSYR
jgi:hypothetical protein